MYHVLVYLFENCEQAELTYDSAGVAKKLSAAGFEDGAINEALVWLAGLARAPRADLEKVPSSGNSFRAYAARELAKLDSACRGFLTTLESSAILAPRTRELVIDRALAAPGDSLTLEQLKLIVLMVLWNEQMPASRLVAEDLFMAGSRLPS